MPIVTFVPDNLAPDNHPFAYPRGVCDAAMASSPGGSARSPSGLTPRGERYQEAAASARQQRHRGAGSSSGVNLPMLFPAPRWCGCCRSRCCSLQQKLLQPGAATGVPRCCCCRSRCSSLQQLLQPPRCRSPLPAVAIAARSAACRPGSGNLHMLFPLPAAAAVAPPGDAACILQQKLSIATGSGSRSSPLPLLPLPVLLLQTGAATTVPRSTLMLLMLLLPAPRCCCCCCSPLLLMLPRPPRCCSPLPDVAVAASGR